MTRAEPRLAGSHLLTRDLSAVPAALIAAGLWAALMTSLEAGRTTILTISVAWALLFAAILAGVVATLVITWLVLWRLAGLPARRAVICVAACCLPLLLSAVPLYAVYGSDEAYHYLVSNPIPRTFVAWIGPFLGLVATEALLVWSWPVWRPCKRLLWRANSVPMLIFFAFSALYILTSGGHLYSPDEREMYAVTESIARGTTPLTHVPATEAVQSGARIWSKYGLVPSILALPPYWISKLLGLSPESPSPAFPVPDSSFPLVDLLVNPIAAAATCAFMYRLAVRTGFSSATSLILVFAYGMATSVWVYSKTFLNQPLTGLFLIAAVICLMDSRGPSPRMYGFAGLLLGLGAGTRLELPIIALPVAVFVLQGLRGDRTKWITSMAALVIVFAVVWLATVGWYNWVKTGSLLLTGHNEQTRGSDFGSKPYIGLFGTFFSSGFGLFTFNPIALLGIYSLATLAAVRRTEAAVFGGLLLTSTLLYSLFDVWYGGFTWANRYMVTVLPFAVLPAGILLERQWRSGISVFFVACAVLLGFGVNLLGVLFDFNLGWLDLWSHQASINQIQFDPHFSPIGAQLRLLRAFLVDGSKLDLYLYYQFGVPALAAGIGCFILFAALAARIALKDRAEWHPKTTNEVNAPSSASISAAVR